MSDKNKAFKNAFEEGIIEALKMVPGLSILIEGIRKYHETMQDEQREKFIYIISERLKALEGKFSTDWYKTDEGIEIAHQQLIILKAGKNRHTLLKGLLHLMTLHSTLLIL